ncbi:MAG: hypothetical protein KME29_34985 [Calothrix sp. FI2-JRJ7]|jgi:hypothetical protein|nr:hypothetical protein [Calothrix sp. FI2-JRJ7]
MTENGNGNGRLRLFDPVLVFIKLLIGWKRENRVSGEENIVEIYDVLDDLDDRLDQPDNPSETEN